MDPRRRPEGRGAGRRYSSISTGSDTTSAPGATVTPLAPPNAAAGDAILTTPHSARRRGGHKQLALAPMTCPPLRLLAVVFRSTQPGAQRFRESIRVAPGADQSYAPLLPIP